MAILTRVVAELARYVNANMGDDRKVRVGWKAAVEFKGILVLDVHKALNFLRVKDVLYSGMGKISNIGGAFNWLGSNVWVFNQNSIKFLG